MKKIILCSLLVLLLVSTGCTIRHSRIIDNGAMKSAGQRISADSTGLEIFNIEVNDTKSADQLLNELRATNNCKNLKNIEVDYRTTLILFVGIPKLTASADCEQ